ncbi:MAG: DUF4437 domain-containing protein [Alphaproteobacteria bacterium]|nr:DUF4437 domain-containing protein [Alphaproteobacteria bacterium]
MSQAKSAAPSKPAYMYDTSNVDWRVFITVGTYYKVLNVDLDAGQADMIVKFDPNAQCMYHRHTATVTTLVLEGEHHVYDVQGDERVLKIKPAGSYSVGGEGELHIEGAGDETLILFFSMRTKGDVIYELLNDDLTLAKSITVAEFYRDWKEHWPADFEKKA